MATWRCSDEQGCSRNHVAKNYHGQSSLLWWKRYSLQIDITFLKNIAPRRCNHMRGCSSNCGDLFLSFHAHKMQSHNSGCKFWYTCYLFWWLKENINYLELSLLSVNLVSPKLNEMKFCRSTSFDCVAGCPEFLVFSTLIRVLVAWCF